MAQWKALNQLCRTNRQVQEQLKEMFSRINFPYKIRSTFAEWIESKDWNCIDDTNDVGKNKAINLFNELMMLIEKHEKNMQAGMFDLDKTLDIQKAKDDLKKAFEGNCSTFAGVVRQCLQREKTMIESCEEDVSEFKRKMKLVSVATENVMINQKLAELLQPFTECESSLQDVTNKQEKFRIDYSNLQALKDLTENSLEIRIARINMEMDKLAAENWCRRNQMVDQITKLANGLVETLQLIWNEIESWQSDQKKMIAALSKPKDGALDVLDKMCDEGGNLLIKVIQLLQAAEENVFMKLVYNNDQKKDELLNILNMFKTIVLPEHLQRIFVVERNIEDRVLKISGGKSGVFSMSLRILGGNNLGLNFNQPKVKMSLFKEKDIPQTNEYYKDGACKIENGQERTFAVNRGNNACVAHFHSAMLKNVKRGEQERNQGKSEELVTEHKYAFVFYTSVIILNEIFKLKVISLPVILTSQASQDIMSKGTLIWDAVFSKQNRKPFECRESVSWGEFAEVLNALFLQNTGRGLNRDHLTYLAKMALRYQEPKIRSNDVDFDRKFVTYKQAVKDKLASTKDFSFWKWFYSCMNLVKLHAKKEWQDGRIFGFISKDDAEEKLAGTPTGTFLLRFSESEIELSQKSASRGILTLAVIQIDPDTGNKKLYHVKEYLRPKEIQEKGLAMILNSMKVANYENPKEKVPLLRHLWPDTLTTFYEIFKPYLPERVTACNGYQPGKCNIEIFLSGEQIRRHRTDSFESMDSGPGSVQSATSFESTTSCEGSTASNSHMMTGPYDYENVSIQPCANFAFPAVMTPQINEIQPQQFVEDVLSDSHLFSELLQPDADGDLMISQAMSFFASQDLPYDGMQCN